MSTPQQMPSPARPSLQGAPGPRQPHGPSGAEARHAALLAELCDGLARRQPEIPSRYLLDPRSRALRERADRLPGCRLEDEERALVAALFPHLRDDHVPRAIVHLFPSAAGSGWLVLDPLLDLATTECYLALDLRPDLSAEAAARTAGRHPRIAALSIDGDLMTELPLPATLARPRLLLCLGNALGSTTTVGAVRRLRAMRAAMRAGDRLLLGLDLRRAGEELERAYNDPAGVLAAYHKSVLDVLNREFGTDFDVSRFDYGATYNAEHRRVEMRLIANRAHAVAVGEAASTAFRKGGSILTSVCCSFTPTCIEAMLNGVGLEVAEWRADERERFAVMVAVAMTRERA